MEGRNLKAVFSLLLILDEFEWRASCPDSFYFWEKAILLSIMQDADWKTDENVADSLVTVLSSFSFMDLNLMKNETVFVSLNCCKQRKVSYSMGSI